MATPDENIENEHLLERLLAEKHAIQSARRKARDLKEQCQRIIADGVPPEIVKQMQSSSRIARAFLQSPDPNVRSAALLFLSYHPDVDSTTLTGIIIGVARTDVEHGLREQALSILGRIHRHTHNEPIGAFLVGVVEDSAEPLNVRAAAYVSLVDVADRQTETPDVAVGEFANSLAVRIDDGRFRFPQDIDLSLISRYRSV